MAPDVVADLDEDGVRYLAEAVADRERDQAWTNTEELLAAVVEALWAVLSRLEAGIGTVSMKRTRKVEERDPYPRPDWIKPAEPPEIVVTHPGDAIRILKEKEGQQDGN